MRRVINRDHQVVRKVGYIVADNADGDIFPQPGRISHFTDRTHFDTVLQDWRRVLAASDWITLNKKSAKTTLNAVGPDLEQRLFTDKIIGPVEIHQFAQPDFERVGRKRLCASIGAVRQEPAFQAFNIVWRARTDVVGMACFPDQVP
jgi:hypothetical protein